MEPFVGGVSNKLVLLTPQLKLSMWMLPESVKETIWLKKFLLDLQVITSANRPITLYCDNSRAVAQSKELRYHKKHKHIERKYHLIQDIIERGDTVVTKIASQENLVDRFTKTLLVLVFVKHVDYMGVKSLPDLL